MYAKLGRKLYFDKVTGDVIVDTGEKQGFVRQTTLEEDFSIYKVLQERVQETVGVIKLEYGQYLRDFMDCNGYRVNPETLEIEFSYPDPSIPVEDQEIIFQKPLSEEVEELKTRQDSTENALLDLLLMGGM